MQDCRVVVAFLLISVFFDSIVANKVILPNVAAWREETEVSAKRNFIFCPYSFVEQYQSNLTISDNRFLIKRVMPSKAEVRSFTETPITLSKAHKDLTVTASMRGYNYDKWGSEKESRWEIPKNHPGQNKRNCIAMTQMVSDGRIYSFYEGFRKVDRTFYLSVIQHGFIHPSGAVMARCGYYMGEELCENRWDYARKWHDDCKEGLKKNAIEWDALFSDELQQMTPPKAWSKMIDTCTDRSDLGIPGKNGIFNITKEDKVFIISSLWDYNYHHFMVDSLARLARNYEFLKKFPLIKIHVRFFEEYDGMYNWNTHFKANAKRMREQLLSLLGIDPARIVTGPVIAKEVYIPRALRCAYALSNPIEIRLLTKLFYQNMRNYIRDNFPALLNFLGTTKNFGKRGSGSTSFAGGFMKKNKFLAENSPAVGNEKNRRQLQQQVQLQQQQPQQQQPQFPQESHLIPPIIYKNENMIHSLSASFIESTSYYWPGGIPSSFINSTKDRPKNMIILQRYNRQSTDRTWDDYTFRQIILSFAQSFPEHNIIPLSSKRLSNPKFCLACDIFLFSQADILVGAHGAGLTNMMFLPTNSLIIEIVGETKDVNMPVCGYYAPFAAIFGHHHYTYAFQFEKQWPILSQQAADESASFYYFLRTKRLPSHSNMIITVDNSTGGFPYQP